MADTGAGNLRQNDAASLDDRSVGELLKQLTEQTATLSRQEARLAQLELTEKGRAAGKGAGLLGASGLIAAFGLAAVLSTVGAALALVLPVWAAILVVAVVLLGIGGILALTGRAQLGSATPPMPRATADTVREDVETIRESARR